MASRKCDVCGARGTLVCSRCKCAAYCSPACQKAAWKGHKNSCHASADGDARGSDKGVRLGAAELEIFVSMQSFAIREMLDAALRLGDFNALCQSIIPVISRGTIERAPVGLVSAILACLESSAATSEDVARNAYGVLGAVTTRFPRDVGIAKTMLASLAVMTGHLREHGTNCVIASAILSLFGTVANMGDITAADAAFSAGLALQVSARMLELHMSRSDQDVAGKVFTLAFLLGRLPGSKTLEVLVAQGYVPLALRAISLRGSKSLSLMGTACWFLRTLISAPQALRSALRGSAVVPVVLGALPEALRTRDKLWTTFAESPCVLLADLFRPGASIVEPLGDFDAEAAVVALCESLEIAVNTAHDEVAHPVVQHIVSCMSSLTRKKAAASSLAVHALGPLRRAAAAHAHLRGVIDATVDMVSTAAQMADLKDELAFRGIKEAAGFFES